MSKKFHTHKIFPCSWNKISQMHHEHIHTSPQHNFFTLPILPKSKPRFIQQHHKLPTLSKFHKPPTLSKLHTMIKKNEHFKNAPKPTLQHDQSYNTPISNKNTQQNDNVSASNFQWSMKQHFSKQINPKKNSPWCPCENMKHGSWDLEGSHPHQANQMLYHISYHEK